MREVLTWQKNYETGECVEVPKVKNNDSFQGRATIQVFGEDGELKSETFTENLITNDLPKNHEYLNNYAYVLEGGDIYAEYSTITSYTFPKSFTNILLCTDDKEEEEDLVVKDMGKVIGWCPRTNTATGSDTRRGAYNTTESFEEYVDGYYHAHRVYDFSTSNSNGTFSSVFWGKGVYNSTSTTLNLAPKFVVNMVIPVGNKRSISYSSSTNGYEYMIKGPADTYYVRKSGYYYKVLNPLNHLAGFESVKLSSESFDKFPISSGVCNRLTLSPTTYVNIGSTVNFVDSAFKPYSELKIFDIATHEVVETIKLELWDNIPAYDLLTRDSSNRQFYADSIMEVFENGDVDIMFRAFTGNGAYYDLPRLESDYTLTPEKESSQQVRGRYNILTKTWVIKPDFSDVQSLIYGKHYDKYKEIFQIKYFGEEKILVRSDYLYSTVKVGANGEYTDIRPYHFNDYLGVALSGTAYLGGFIEDTNMVISYSGRGDMAISTGYSAHTKLPNPVTKTSSDTMKIQYDYYVQCPTHFPINGSYLENPKDFD